jgi:hypothetical protein
VIKAQHHISNSFINKADVGNAFTFKAQLFAIVIATTRLETL